MVKSVNVVLVEHEGPPLSPPSSRAVGRRQREGGRRGRRRRPRSLGRSMSAPRPQSTPPLGAVVTSPQSDCLCRSQTRAPQCLRFNEKLSLIVKQCEKKNAAQERRRTKFMFKISLRSVYVFSEKNYRPILSGGSLNSINSHHTVEHRCSR